MRLSFPGPFDGAYGEEVERQIREWRGSLPGRPSKADEHRQWADTFLRLRGDMNGEDAYGASDEKLNKIELSQLVVDELGLSVTARAVWDAVKPLIPD